MLLVVMNTSCCSQHRNTYVPSFVSFHIPCRLFFISYSRRDQRGLFFS
uniref:Uncharacterized protein n=1 Tax=Anopheles dirus TaxID=7168 RepID=A0A182NWE3_9DIPT